MTITGKTNSIKKIPAEAWPPGDHPDALPSRVGFARVLSERRLAARRISALTKRATAALDHTVKPAAGPGRTGDDGLMTPRQVAGLLKIDIDTVRRWRELGVLRQAPPPAGRHSFRRADVLTFLAGSRRTPRRRGHFTGAH